MAYYLSSIFTDHRALYIVIELNPFERGKGFWKFNNSLLQQQEFLDIMNKEIDTTLELCSQKDPKQTWETLKQRIAKTSKHFSKKNASREQSNNSSVD